MFTNTALAKQLNILYIKEIYTHTNQFNQYNFSQMKCYLIVLIKCNLKTPFNATTSVTELIALRKLFTPF